MEKLKKMFVKANASIDEFLAGVEGYYGTGEKVLVVSIFSFVFYLLLAILFDAVAIYLIALLVIAVIAYLAFRYDDEVQRIVDKEGSYFKTKMVPWVKSLEEGKHAEFIEDLLLANLPWWKCVAFAIPAIIFYALLTGFIMITAVIEWYIDKKRAKIDKELEEEIRREEESEK
jgi:hypothetical protein